jgi:mono/diheme cytochrome c family protein
MFKRLLKIAGYIAASLVVIVGILIVVVLIRSRRTFDAPYPVIQASRDPQVIARGRYIVHGPGHCVACHVNAEEQKEVASGGMPLLAGGNAFVLPVGTFYTRNLTPDRETGIGRYTDAQLARVLRHGVMPSGRAAIPFMEAQNMSDEDLTAVISFLRSQPAVRRAVPEHRVNLLGKAILAFVIKPIGPSRPVRKHTPAEEPTIERGEYMATSVAACSSCHTKRNKVDGSYVNARFSGGSVMEIEGDPNNVLVTPNLTPAKTGRITSWSEEQFVGRFGVGMGVKGTHMPWKSFQRMSETDVRAIYRYLKSLEPVEHATGASVQPKKKDA